MDQTVRIRNSQSTDMELHLEPWGEVFILQPGAVVDVVARGPDDGSLEIETREGHVVVYGWVGSIVTVNRDGREISSGKRIPATWMD